MHKYPVYAPKNAGASSILSSPPLASDLSSIVSSVKSESSASPMTYWATSQDPSSPYTSGSLMSSAYAGEHSFMGRHSYSPTAREGFVPSHYTHPPFPNHMSVSGSGEGHHQQQSLHHQHQHQQQRMSPASQQSSQVSPQGPLHTPDNYGHPPGSSTHYLPSSTLQQNAFTGYSPSQHSPQSASETSGQLSPVIGHGPGNSTMAAATYHRPYGGYNLPAMAGPGMSHMHAPDAQMSMVSGMHMGPYPQHLGEPFFESHEGQRQAQNDRPFKCDQCRQSFNRNHDLKRHRRIHLAVKPFPCVKCDKSFSRKDALKRHILVKSCGGVLKNASGSAADDSLSPQNDVVSDSQSDHSPGKAKLY